MQIEYSIYPFLCLAINAKNVQNVDDIDETHLKLVVDGKKTFIQ